MPSVKVNHCLICDSAREETRNKITLLGFFGVAPHVEIRLDNVELPVTELTFVFLGLVTGDVGPIEVNMELFDFNDSPLFSHPQTVELKPTERANLIFNIRLLRFPHVGRYKIRLRADGRPVFNSDFLISKKLLAS